jgi:hypothetical protein
MPIRTSEKILFALILVALAVVQVQSRVLSPEPKIIEEYRPTGEVFPDFQFTLLGETKPRSLSDFNREHPLLVLAFSDCGCFDDLDAKKRRLAVLWITSIPAGHFKKEVERNYFVAPGMEIPSGWHVPKKKDSYYLVLAPGRRVVYRGEWYGFQEAFPEINRGRK